MQQIRIDFDNPGLPQSLGAVEGESQSRIFQVTLYKSGAAYTAPAGAVYSIMYRGFGPQNQGWYDTIEDGAGKRAACTVSGNVVTCELARQALRVPGHLTVVLCVTDAKGYMLKNWPIMADVRNDGYEDTGESEMYFNLSGIAGNYLTQLEKAMTDAETTRNNLISTSAQVKKDIDAKAAETLKTIPESYTELDGSVKQIREDLDETENRKVSYDELITGHKYTNTNDLKIGYISVSAGVEDEKIRSVYTKDFFPNDTVVNVTDADKIGLAIYKYNKNNLLFNSAAVDVQMPFTVNSSENVLKFAFYYKETGLYTNISNVKANALKKYIKIQSNEKTELKGNNAGIDEINLRLNDIEEDLSYVNPYYFTDDYLQNKVKSINDNMCEIGLNGESFVFITDPHWDLGNAKQSPKLIKYIKEKTNIDNIICGGDIINEGLHDTMLEVFLDFVNEMKKIGIPFPIAFGNHDMNTNANNSQSEWFDRNTVFDIEYKHVAKFITFISPDNDFSFTYDRPEIKTRFIFIDTQKNGSVKWEAITPISESFNKVPEDYKVVVVCHWLFGNNSILTGWGQRILDTIDAYNARTTYTNDQTKTYDYTNASGKCVLVCCGHTHYDTQIVTNGGIPVLNTTCDNYNRSNSGLERKKGTITEQAFDVVSIKYADDSVKVVRIGSGNDRIFSQGKWEVIN